MRASWSRVKEVCADVRRRKIWVSVLTVGMLGLMGSAQRADADPVAPVKVEGNATCASLGSGEYELKIEPVDSGTFDVPGFGTVTITSDRRLLDWSSSFPINAVFVKGGPDGNLYVYDPPAMGDTGLHAPINDKNGRPYGLSHVSFCYDEPPPVCSLDCGDQAICTSESAGCCAIGSDGVPPYTYLWSGPASFASTDACIDVVDAQSGDGGVYSATVIDSRGHQSIEECAFTLTVTDPPTCTVNPPAEPFVLTGSISGGLGPHTCSAVAYTTGWFVGPDDCVVDGLTFRLTYSVVQPAVPAGSFTVTVTDANGCTSTCDMDFFFPAGCAISPGFQEVCQGAPAGTFCTEPLGFPPHAFEWTAPDGFTGDTECVTPPTGTPGTGMYCVVVTEALGFSSPPCCAPMVVNPSPDCSITGESTICEGETTSFCAPAGAACYTWTGPPNVVLPQACDVPCIIASVAGEYCVTVRNVDGCESRCCQTLTVEPCGEGCTPGFWRNHGYLWDGAWTDDVTVTIKTTDGFNATFGVTPSQSGLANSKTLLNVVNLGGGGTKALARHAAAAAISADASAVAYPYSLQEVIDLYRDGLGADPGPETVQSAKFKLATANEMGCPF